MKPEQEILELLEKTAEAALGTVENGKPYVSATGILFDPSEDAEAFYGKVYMLLSDLARHTKNLKSMPEASLLILERREHAPVHEARRMTLQGRIELVRDTVLFDFLKKRYLERFPRSEIFFQLPDFRFYELNIREIHWIGGFGKARTFP